MTSGALTSFHSRVQSEDVSNDYYLISSKSCPYAHRTEIVRNLKGLHHNITIVYCDPAFKFTGWSLDYEYNGYNPSKIFNSPKLLDLYKLSEPSYEGRGTLPLLHNRTSNKIVNNESSEIIKIFNADFNRILNNGIDFISRDFER